MTKRKFDLTVKADIQLTLRYLDELDSDDLAKNLKDNVSIASEKEDFVKNIEVVQDILYVDHLNENNHISSNSGSDEPLTNLRVKYFSNLWYIFKKKLFETC